MVPNKWYAGLEHYFTGLDVVPTTTQGKSPLSPAPGQDISRTNKDAEIIAGILRVEAGNDRSNWVAKLKPPLGEIVRLDGQCPHGISFSEACHAGDCFRDPSDWAYRFVADYHWPLEEYFAEQSDGDDNVLPPDIPATDHPDYYAPVDSSFDPPPYTAHDYFEE